MSQFTSRLYWSLMVGRYKWPAPLSNELHRWSRSATHTQLLWVKLINERQDKTKTPTHTSPLGILSHCVFLAHKGLNYNQNKFAHSRMFIKIEKYKKLEFFKNNFYFQKNDNKDKISNISVSINNHTKFEQNPLILHKIMALYKE